MKKGVLTGLLLFGFFFGAGNLIFPPSLGYQSAEQFWPAVIGFIVSGVGLAIGTLLMVDSKKNWTKRFIQSSHWHF